MLAFYNTIDWFRPSFVLMENVLDIFKKGDGLYAKMAASILLDMDYQTRTGIIAACHHGAPQGRWRCSERDTSLLFYPLLLQPHSESTQVTDASP